MTNVEYIFEFANKHNFPKTNCEVMFKDVKGDKNIFNNDDEITSVKFDKSLVDNEIDIKDIRFDVDSDFPDDVFFMWQKDMPDVSFKTWISMGRYVPTIIKNTEFLYDLEKLTKEIEMKMENLFSSFEIDDGDSDYYDDDDEDSDYYEDDSDYYEDDED